MVIFIKREKEREEREEREREGGRRKRMEREGRGEICAEGERRRKNGKSRVYRVAGCALRTMQEGRVEGEARGAGGEVLPGERILEILRAPASEDEQATGLSALVIFRRAAWRAGPPQTLVSAAGFCQAAERKQEVKIVVAEKKDLSQLKRSGQDGRRTRGKGTMGPSF